MNRGFGLRALWMVQTVVLCLLFVTLANGQSTPQAKPQMADEVFKNVQVLRGLTVDEFMGTMGFIAASLSMNCSECHHIGSAAQYAEDTPLKQTARRMIVMTEAFDRANFGGKRMVTCYSCHRSEARPKTTPSLLEQYSSPPPDDPNEVEIEGTSPPGVPSPDQVLDKYIQALGGAQRLAGLTSFVARGTYQGFDTDGDKVPVEVYAKSPNQRSTIVHLHVGDNIRTFDGRNAWTTSAGTLLPLPVLVLTGGDLEGARIDANFCFPGQIKQTLKEWRTGFPSTTIDDKDVEVLQGTSSTNSPVKLYFNKKSGLLVRQVRYTDTPIGLIPAQIDYADYRDVSGVKMPFRWTVTWTDGRSTTEVSEVRTNVSIDPSRFSEPTTTAPRKP